jgi:deoxyribodipyrimidine photolyase
LPMPQTIQEIVDLCPDYLRERCRVLGGATTSKAGEYVLYWMRTAIRTNENPALDFSILTANKLGLPILVYQALTEKYPYASDRHHTFILQGARDVQQAFQSQEIAYAFHLERTGQRGPHLKCLAERAALVATEDMPTEPLRRWTESLARRASTPWVAVDTACVVPLQLVGKAYERAFEYRNATRTLYEKWLPAKLEQVELKLPSTLPSDLPFKPVDLQNVDTNELVAACEIDHSIGPVPHTMGGSAAGFDRWQQFKKNKLKSYAKARNNPLADSVSRLSAYLHYGMISPMRIARETAEIDVAGAEKYLDELLIWRELAYAFCFYRRDHYRTSALPDWALATLAQHEIDRRGALLSWEVLARGRTQDLLWDAAQRCLLIHGELHNNVRMTWGKA